MPIDWGQVIQIAATAGPAIAGGILGNREQNQGLQLSREDLAKALDASIRAQAEGVNAAVPYFDWNLRQGLTGGDWASQNALAAKGWGYNTAMAAKGNALQNSLNILNQGNQASQSYLQPFTNVGQNALATLSQRVLGRGIPGGAAPSSPPQFRFPVPARTSAPPMGANPAYRNALSSIPKFEPLSTTGTTGPLTESLMRPNYPGSYESNTGKTALNFVIPGLGNLVGHFTRAGREREAASGGAEALSNYIWKNLQPQVKAGKISPQDFEKLVKQAWAEYSGWLQNDNGPFKDKDVINNSVADQRQWTNKGLADAGYTFTV